MIGVAFKGDETIIKSNQHVYQWDTGQKIMVSGLGNSNINQVHFSFNGLKTAYPVNVTISSGTVTVNIPNIVLRYGKDVYMYLCIKNTNGTVVTIKTVIIPVIKRNMPENYMYDDNETVAVKLDELQTEIQRSTAVDTEHENRLVSLEEAKTNSSGTTFSTLKERIDNDFNVLNNDFNVLNNDLSQVCEVNEILFTNGYNINLSMNVGSVVSLTPETVSSYRYAIYNCEYGDKFLLNCKGGVSPRAYAFIDDENKLLLKSDMNVTLTNEVITAPLSAKKIIINDNKTGGKCWANYLPARVSVLEGDVLKLNEDNKVLMGFVQNVTLIHNTSGSKYPISMVKDKIYNIKVTSTGSGNLFVYGKDEHQYWVTTLTSGTQIIKYQALDDIIYCNAQSDYNIDVEITSIEKSSNEKIIDISGTNLLLDNSEKYEISIPADIGSTVNLTVGTSKEYRHIIVDCVEGERFVISGQGGTNPKLWAFIDANNKLVNRSTYNYTTLDELITAPKNSVKLIMNYMVNGAEWYLGRCESDVHSLNARLKSTETSSKSAYDHSINLTLKNTPDQEIGAYIRGVKFSEQLKNPIVDFAKPNDKMVHVSTITTVGNTMYCTYYANTRNYAEEPTEHTARFAYTTLNGEAVGTITYVDLQDVGETYDGQTVTAIYDTILLRKDDNVLYLMWTAQIGGVYYRLYRTYTISTGTLSEIMKNNFYVGERGGVWNTTNMTNLLSSVEHKYISGDIGIMQKLSTNVENDETWYYTGAYAKEFNCIIKSKDLINWYYVSTPTFANESEFENAVYVLNGRVYYFCRQLAHCNSAFLATYDIENDVWSNPIFVHDCQSRSDFFVYDNNLYLVHAPYDRSHITIKHIAYGDIKKTYDIQTARVPDYFYPFVYVSNDNIYMSFTQSRKHIYVSKFELNTISDSVIEEKFYQLFMLN